MTLRGARRARWVVGALLLGITAVAVPLAGPIWNRISIDKGTEDYFVSGVMRVNGVPSQVRWYTWRARWRGNIVQHGYYYCRSGFVCSENTVVGGERRLTLYLPDGRVHKQRSYKRIGNSSQEEFRTEPPWWWGVTDQSHPTAPWLNDGK